MTKKHYGQYPEGTIGVVSVGRTKEGGVGRGHAEPTRDQSVPGAVATGRISNEVIASLGTVPDHLGHYVEEVGRPATRADATQTDVTREVYPDLDVQGF